MVLPCDLNYNFAILARLWFFLFTAKLRFHFFRKLDEPLYSLRCQIEILFKTWKSFFEIDECKNIKRKCLEYHLYGQLIGILLCSSTM
ncbi:transposase, partial [Bacillus sanguinis]|uniref:transposase n=1 Tax=Bacillus sanguinis TaxID=2817476 RepID=UPI00236883E4